MPSNLKTTAHLAGKSRLYQATQKRLKEMSSHHFVKLEDEGEWSLVGDEEDPWTADELELAFERVESLASDPARGEKVTPAGLEEAAVALTAENLHVFDSLERETTGGSEFVDSSGRSWDVKSPISPPEKYKDWHFSPHHHLNKVRKDFDHGDSVLLNLTKLRPEHRDQTLDLLSAELTVDEYGKLLVLTDLPAEGQEA